MIRYIKNCNLPENPEILFMLILGILLQMTDGSPFSMKYRWRLVWDIELPAEYFSLFAQKIIKIILTIIIMVRCSTTYAYVVSAMLVIFCLLKKTTPKLMLLWLFVAGVKSICMTFAEAIAGVYVCSAFGKIRKACIEFFVSKALEIIFAAYLWGNVLSIYQDMESKARDEANQTKDLLFSNFTRQRARSLLDESTLYRTACLNNFEFKDVPQIILQMLRRDDEMSEDSLLGPGMMLASVSNLGSFDNLKTSQSLGELGFTDLGTTQVVGLEEDENLSHRDKVLRFLKLTKSEVAKIQLNKSTVENDIYKVEDDIWARVMASGTHINKPKQTRTEVFIREIPQPEETVTKTENQRKVALKVGVTFSNLLVGKQGELQDDQDEEDSLVFSQEEEEGKEDEETYRLFMSNIKEGVFINRHGLGFGIKIMKGNRYEKLYKEDFMSIIGPEVFERATNLPKVTSFTKIMRHSVSLPEILQTNRKKNISPDDSQGKIDQNSSSESYSRNPEFSTKQILHEESFSDEEVENIIEKISIADEILTKGSLQTEFEKAENETTKQSEEKLKLKNESEELLNMESEVCLPSSNLSITDLDKVKKIKPCFRKRRVLIKRMGKQKTIQTQNLSFNSWCSIKSSSSGSDHLIGSQVQYDKKDSENPLESNTVLPKLENSSENSDDEISKIPSKAPKNQMYFLTEILEKPHWKISISYFNLNKDMHSQKQSKLLSPESKLSFLNSQLNNCQNKYEKMLHSAEVGPREEKIWKSNVLKTVETCFMPKYSQTFEPSLKNTSLLTEKYEKKTKYLHFLNKKECFLEKEKDKLILGSYALERLFTSNVKSTCFNVIQDVKAKRKTTLKTSQNFGNLDVDITDTFASVQNNKESEENSTFWGSNNTPEVFMSQKNSKLVTASDISSQPCIAGLMKNDTKNGIINQVESNTSEMIVEKKLNLVTFSEALAKEDSFCSQESDEPISLYYSKAADLASPLLDMKRFIYPDHIHYSYKHVNKKGFDVNINGGFPLLVGENLPMSSPMNVMNESTSKNQASEIKRRPMDLSFATTNAFADWQNNYSNDPETNQNHITDNNSSVKKESESLDADAKNMKAKKIKYFKKINERKESRLLNGFIRSKSKPKPYGKNFSDVAFMYSAKDYMLIEKLLRMHVQFNKNEFLDFESRASERRPVQISSTQLHSNKGRKNSIKNPAIFLQKNKSRSEKKKIDTHEERTKDMFARLASEAFLQSSNLYSSSGSKRNI